MRIFVAGASGVLGRQLVPLLADAGHEVVGTTTSARKLETLRALGAQPVVLDLLDAEAVGRAISEAEPEVSSTRRPRSAASAGASGSSTRRSRRRTGFARKERTTCSPPRWGSGRGSSLLRAMRAGPWRARARPLRTKTPLS